MNVGENWNEHLQVKIFFVMSERQKSISSNYDFVGDCYYLLCCMQIELSIEKKEVWNGYYIRSLNNNIKILMMKKKMLDIIGIFTLAKN